MPNELVPVMTFEPVMTIEQSVALYEKTRDFVRRLMKKDVDYGVIPGTEKKRTNSDGTPTPEENTLLQPGGEKLCKFFGLVPDYENTGHIVDFEKGFFHYSYKCVLLRDACRENIDGKAVILGRFAGAGEGSCNSLEKKFRRGTRVCPECGKDNIRRSGKRDNDPPGYVPGYYCWAKTGGCGKNFVHNDARITEQTAKVDPLEVADLVNNIQKRAQKRAFLSAVKTATNASEFYTVDMEAGEHEPAEPSRREEPPRREESQPESTTVSKKQWAEIYGWVQKNGLSLPKILEHYVIKRPGELPKEHFNDCLQKAKDGFAGWKPTADTDVVDEWKKFIATEPKLEELNKALANLDKADKPTRDKVMNEVVLPATNEAGLVYDVATKQFAFPAETASA
jgi:hypothetical protein